MRKRWLAAALGAVVLSLPAVASAPTAQAQTPDATVEDNLRERLEAGEVIEIRADVPEGSALDVEEDSVITNPKTGEDLLAGVHLERIESVEELDKLLASGQVENITENKMAVPEGSATNSVTGAARLHTAGFTGAGTTIGIIDTGFDTANSSFSGRIVEEVCISENGFCDDPGTGPNEDATGGGLTFRSAAGVAGYGATTSNNHGTVVTSAAASAHGSTAKGTAPGADLVLVRFGGTFADAEASMAYLASQQNSGAYADPLVAVNYSYGGLTLQSSTCTSIYNNESADLYAEDVLLTVSAGNANNHNAINGGSCDATTVAVSGLDANGTYRATGGGASNPNWANHEVLDTAAPWSVVVDQVGGGTTTEAGTSVAAPQAAGMIALLREAVPTATAGQILETLRNSGSLAWDQTYYAFPGSASDDVNRTLDAEAHIERLKEIQAESSTKFNPMHNNRVITADGNGNPSTLPGGDDTLGGNGTDTTIDIPQMLDLAPGDAKGFFAEVTLYNCNGHATTLHARAGGDTYNGVSGLYAQSNEVKTQRMWFPVNTTTGETAVRVGTGCAAGMKWLVDVIGWFPASSDINLVTPYRELNGVAQGTTTTQRTLNGLPSGVTGILAVPAYIRTGGGYLDCGDDAAAAAGNQTIVRTLSGEIKVDLVWIKATAAGGGAKSTIYCKSDGASATLYLDILAYTTSGTGSVVVTEGDRIYSSTDVGQSILSAGTSRSNTMLNVGGVPASNVRAVDLVVGNHSMATCNALLSLYQLTAYAVGEPDSSECTNGVNTTLVSAIGTGVGVAALNMSTHYFLETGAYYPS